MPETATAIGPVLRMCEDPACHGAASCPTAGADRARVAGRTLALADSLSLTGLTGEGVCAFFAQELVLCGARLSAGGTLLQIPDGTEFRLHRGPLVSGGERWEAWYCGPETTIEGILAGAEPYPDEAAWSDVIPPRMQAVQRTHREALDRFAMECEALRA